MSSQRDRHPNETEPLHSALYAMESEIENKIDAIVRQRPSGSTIGESYDWTVSRTREIQLLTLTHYVLDVMSECHDNTIVIDVDDPENLLTMIELPEAAFFEESPEEAGYAVEEGALLGRDDFLELLAPEEEDNLMTRKLHYYPWGRAIIESAIERGSPSFHPAKAPDASRLLRQPTRLPNIEVLFSYGPNEDVPQRLIKVKNEQVSARPSTPATPATPKQHYESTRIVFDRVHNQAIRKIHQLAKDYSILKQEHPTSYTEIITLAQRGQQLHRLLSQVLGMSEADVSGDAIALDDLDQRITDPPQLLLPEERSPLSTQDVEEADQDGLRQGTDDFLSIIVPDHITDPAARQLYFSPWRRDLFEQYFPPMTIDETGVLSLSLPTALPNIDMRFSYEDGSEYPQRTLYVNGQYTLP